MHDVDSDALSVLVRLERAIDMYLGRSAWTQTNHLKGLVYSQAIRKELFDAHDAARQTIKSVPAKRVVI